MRIGRFTVIFALYHFILLFALTGIQIKFYLFLAYLRFYRFDYPNSCCSLLDITQKVNSLIMSKFSDFSRTIFHNFRQVAGFQNWLPEFPGLLPENVLFDLPDKFTDLIQFRSMDLTNYTLFENSWHEEVEFAKIVVKIRKILHYFV